MKMCNKENTHCLFPNMLCFSFQNLSLFFDASSFMNQPKVNFAGKVCLAALGRIVFMFCFLFYFFVLLLNHRNSFA